MSLPQHQKLEYAPGKDLFVWMPPSQREKRPLLIFLHGGGLVKGLGDAEQILQPVRQWLISHAINKDLAFISAGYSLLPDQKVSDILDDIQNLWTYLKNDSRFDVNRIGIVSSSAGGYVASQIGLYCEPRPKALGLQWPMGQDMLSDHWLKTHKQTPSYIADLSSTNLLVKSFDDGNYLDHFTGQLGLSEKLRSLPVAERAAAVPAEHRKLFPQLNMDKHFPPTALIHGTGDTIVPSTESTVIAERLRQLDVEHQLELSPAGEHGLSGSNEDEAVTQGRRERMADFVIRRMLA